MTHTNEASRACPLCGGDNTPIIARIRADQIIRSSPYYDDSSYERLGVSPSATYGISQCRECDFVFASQVPSDEFLERLYGGEGAIESAVRIFARPGRAAYAFRALSRLLQAIAARTNVDGKGVAEHPIKILDVGCAYGVGSLGLIHCHYPYEVAGVEWSKSTRDYLSSQGMAAYSSLDDVAAGTVFDGILLNDILEHVPNPVDVVTKLRELSDSRTVIWVSVPNFIDWRLSDIVIQIDAGSTSIPTDLNPWEHLSYFSPRTLDALMKIAGAKRLTENPVEYPIACESIGEVFKAWARVARDVWRIYTHKYPRGFTTAAIFVFGE